MQCDVFICDIIEVGHSFYKITFLGMKCGSEKKYFNQQKRNEFPGALIAIFCGKIRQIERHGRFSIYIEILRSLIKCKL